MPRLSVIIPCKDHADELKDCLAGFRGMNTRTPFEIIVVDSAASPDVLSVIKNFPEVRLVRSNANLDAASARNRGVAESSGNYLGFIDADCTPGRKWVDAACRALQEGAKMVGGPVLDAYPTHPISSADNVLQFADLSDGRPEGSIGILPGGNLAVCRKIFHQVDGFPIAQHIEDVLFSGRIAAIWPEQCRFIPEMVVFHKGRRNLTGVWEHQYHFGYQRGFYGFRITRKQQKLGRFYAMMPLVVMKRLVYIYGRIFRWNRKSAFFYLSLFPFILYGLAGWAMGFQQGCNAAFLKK
jgi:glycosyltransferase involved in cell wall biosynthesis